MFLETNKAPVSTSYSAYLSTLARVGDKDLEAELHHQVMALRQEAADRAIDLMLKIIELREHGTRPDFGDGPSS